MTHAAALAACPADRRPQLVEALFVFACVWAFGGALPADRGPAAGGHRLAFSRWWAAEWRAVAYPPRVAAGEDGATVFDYRVDEATFAMVPWADRVPAFAYSAAEAARGRLFVPTAETARLSWLAEGLVAHG
jgi:hypothetical protein